MPIPYLGSKKKSAKRIFEVIHNLNSFIEPKPVLVDLFAGGFAIGEYFMRNGYQVIANDKNKYVMALLQEAVKGLDPIVYDWVSREKFVEIIKNPNNYPDWYVGLIMNMWSFGNDQRSYLYGKKIESYKKAMHYMVVNKEVELAKEFMSLEAIDKILSLETINKRRLALRTHYLDIIKTKRVDKLTPVLHLLNKKQLEWYNLVATQHLENLLKIGQSKQSQDMELLQQLQHLERLQHLEDLENLLKIEQSKQSQDMELLQQRQHLEQLQHLEHLERLKHLTQLTQSEQLKQLQQLKIYTLDYQDVPIPERAIIYCDPPYRGRAKYHIKDFNHGDFWNWVRKQSQTHKVYVSEYQAPDDFVKVLEFEKRSTLHGGQNSGQPNECVFIYQT